MKRRDLILASAAACITCAAVSASAAKRVSRVLYLATMTALNQAEIMERIAQRLGERGFIRGESLELRMIVIPAGAENAAESIRAALVWKPDVVITLGTFVTHETQKATADIPIVFTQVADPRRAGIVRELARPGSNTTGVTQFYIQLAGKRLELVREILPSARRVAVIWDRGHPFWPGFQQEFIDTAAALGLTVLEGDMARGERNLSDCYRQVLPARPDALIPIAPWPSMRRPASAEETMQIFQERTHIPVFHGGILPAADPLLVQLGPDIFDHEGRCADIVARILGGEKPGDISVDRATRILLKINLVTAHRLGIQIPKSVLLRADVVTQ